MGHRDVVWLDRKLVHELVVTHDGDQPGGGGTDRFRIKITRGSSTVIYDNRDGKPEDLDNADPTALGGGSIVIHK